MSRAIGRAIAREIERQEKKQRNYRRSQEEAAARPESKYVQTPSGDFWMSPIETKLFDAMQREGLTPVPQFRVDWYIVDFAFPEIKLAVEADGSYHREPERHQHDRKRDRTLYAKGWTVKRFKGTTIHTRASNCAVVIKREVEMRQSINRIHARRDQLRWDRRRKAVVRPFRKIASLLRRRKT